MIPGGGGLFNAGLRFKELPTRTFKLNAEKGIAVGETDGIDAMKQAIYIILNVERYSCILHSRSFGVSLASLFGKPVSFVIPEIERRVTEALLQDTRIKGVGNFSFETRKGVVHTTFHAETVFGGVTVEKDVVV